MQGGGDVKVSASSQGPPFSLLLWMLKIKESVEYNYDQPPTDTPTGSKQKKKEIQKRDMNISFFLNQSLSFFCLFTSFLQVWVDYTDKRERKGRGGM